MTGSLEKQEMQYPPGKFVSIYITSKRIHANQLLELRKNWPHLYFTAKWPVVRDITAEQARPAVHWLQDNVDDIVRSDVFMCFAETDDNLNGSIWEAGVAWAHNKPIYLVGENAGYKEWAHARNTRRIGSLESALSEVQDRLRYRKSDVEKIMDQLGRISDDIVNLKARILDK